MIRGIHLSARLKAVSGMVTAGCSVCDVGCDHGYLSIYLIEQKISPKVLAMDVRKGPLGHAREHVAKAGLEDYITLRLSDGLDGFEAGEAESLVLAGMGGRLMQRILEREPQKTKAFRELILQPQSELAGLRRFLRSEGYAVQAEDMVWEEGKYYPVIKALPGALERSTKSLEETETDRELEDRYGSCLLREKHPVLLSYLKEEREALGRLIQTLEEAGESKRAAKRMEELSKEMGYTQEAIRLCSN